MTVFIVGEEAQKPAEHRINIMGGCGLNCKYCFVAHHCLQHGRIRQRSDWASLNRSYSGAMKDEYPYFDGVGVYPTAHDIEPRHLPHHIAFIKKQIAAGNQLQISTKAHFECIDEICRVFEPHKEQISFMFTITSLNDQVSRFWEVNAPTPYERVASLMLAQKHGFRTSVNIEPMLEGPKEAVAVFRRVEPFVSEEIWIGKMNSPTLRVDTTIKENDDAVKQILRIQASGNMVKLVKELYTEPKVRWHDSVIRDVEKEPTGGEWVTAFDPEKPDQKPHARWLSPEEREYCYKAETALYEELYKTNPELFISDEEC